MNDDFFQKFDSSLALLTSENMRWKSNHQVVEYNFELSIPITAADSVVKYQFMTTSFDIGFAISFLSPEGRILTVLENRRVNSHVDPVIGSCTVTKPGKLVFVWDNSYSWFTPKTLAYSVTLVPPQLTLSPEQALKLTPANERSFIELSKTVGAIGQCREQLGLLREDSQALASELSGIEEEIARLQGLREKKQSSLDILESRIGEAFEQGQQLVARVPGLGVRSLPPPALRLVLAFAGPQTQLVNKEWCRLVNDGAEVWNQGSHTGKESKEEEEGKGEEEEEEEEEEGKGEGGNQDQA